MSNFDRWLTTDRAAEAADAYADHVIESWEAYAEANHLPIDACADDHEAHALYQAWEQLLRLTDEYHARIAEAEWADSMQDPTQEGTRQ